MARRGNGRGTGSGGGTIDELIDVGGATSEDTFALIAGAAHLCGFGAQQISPERMRLVGKVPRRWARRAHRILAVPSLGASRALLRWRVPAEAFAVVSQGPSGCKVRLSGDAPETLPDVIRREIAQRRALSMVASAGTGAAPALPNVTGAPNTADTTADSTATVARPRYLDLSATAPRLTFDSGVTLTIHGYALIGRSPTPDPDDPPAQLLPIEDQELSISKTHLAVGVDARGFWVSDRHSTNGSTVTGPDRIPVRCMPGQRYYVLPGSTVRIGDRSFDVALSDMSVAGPR